MTINGVSTCQTAGTEKYERFQLGTGRRRRTLVQYDYRHTDMELFSCVKPTLGMDFMIRRTSIGLSLPSSFR